VKSQLNPNQVKMLALAAVLILGAAVAGWFGFSSLGDKQVEAQTLAEKIGNPQLGPLLESPEAPRRAEKDAQEIAKLTKELEQAKNSPSLRWAEGTRQATGDGQEWAKDPGKWQEALVQTQGQLLALSRSAPASAQVAISPDFYLGLDAYRQKSPSPQEVPGLAVHLSVARHLVEKLMEARKVREQFKTPCRLESITGPGTVSGESGGAPAAALPAGSPPGSGRKMFRIKLECSPEVLFEYVRLLSEDDWPLIVRGISLSNELQDFPPRSEIAKKFSSPAESTPAEGAPQPAPEGGVKKDQKLLQILSGKEKLIVEMEVDFQPWGTPAVSKGVPAGKTP